MASPDYAHHFSVRNVPFGIASSKAHPKAQAVTRLGNSVVFLNDCHVGGLFEGIEGLRLGIFANDSLNAFAALPQSTHQHVRRIIQGTCQDRTLDVSKLPLGSAEDIAQVQMHLPVSVGDFAGAVPSSICYHFMASLC